MAKVHVKGTIIRDDMQRIYEWIGIEATSPSKVHAVLSNSKEDIEVIINSVGGDIFAGSEIFTALKDYDGKVTVKVVGLAASAASVIAMAGDKIMMSPTAHMMIHNVSVATAGDYRKMEQVAEVLKSTNQSIINAYKTRTNKTDEELQALMDKETWFNAQSAVEHGFADEIMFEQNQQQTSTFVANLGANLLNDEVVAKIAQLIEMNEKQENTFVGNAEEMQARLKLLQLGGI